MTVTQSLDTGLTVLYLTSPFVSYSNGKFSRPNLPPEVFRTNDIQMALGGRPHPGASQQHLVRKDFLGALESLRMGVS